MCTMYVRSNEENICSLSWVPSTEVQKLLEVPEWYKCPYYANELTHLRGERALKRPAFDLITGLALWEGKRTRDLVQSHGQWFTEAPLCRESPAKALDTEARSCFLAGEHTDVRGGCPPQLHGRRQGSSASRALPDLTPCVGFKIKLSKCKYSIFSEFCELL